MSKLLTSLALSLSLVSMAGCAVASEPVVTNAEQEQVKMVIFSVCQGHWNADHSEFTLTPSTECSKAAEQLKDSLEQNGKTELAEFVGQLQDYYGM